MRVTSLNGSPDLAPFAGVLAAFTAESDSMAYIVGGSDGRVSYASPLTAARLGRTAEELQGVPLADLASPGSRDDVAGALERGLPVKHLRLSLVDASGCEWHLASRLAFAQGTFLLLGRTVEPAARGNDPTEREALIAHVREDERRRLARDLHDSAQQQLLAVGIELELEADRAHDDAGLNARLNAVREHVDRAVQAIREVAQGLYPSLLADRGLEEGLGAATQRLSVPVNIRSRAVRRYTPEIEKAVYFSCLEAVQNAVKHAGATSITIDMCEQNRLLSFHVRDDGNGFDPDEQAAGTGLTGIARRVTEVGGRTEIHSAIGHGTTVTGTISLEPSAPTRPSGRAASPGRGG